MQLPAIDEQEAALPAQARWAVDGTDAEESEPEEAALDGEFLFPVTLFEKNKGLFDLGMLNLFGTLVPLSIRPGHSEHGMKSPIRSPYSCRRKQRGRPRALGGRVPLPGSREIGAPAGRSA